RLATSRGRVMNRDAWREATLAYHKDRAGRANVAWDLDRAEDREKAARLRRLIADPKVSLEGMLSEFSRERPTPQSTVEAILYDVRPRGVAALNDPQNVERLARCDEAAKAQINKRIEKILSEKKGASDGTIKGTK